MLHEQRLWAMRLFAAVLLLVIGLAGGPAVAQTLRPDADGWVTLGRHTVPSGASSARLAVNPGSGRYNASRLIVISGTLEIERVVVYYANGSTHYEDRQLTLAAGERMARMDDRDEEREIEFIDVYVKTGAVTAGPVIVEIGGIKRSAARTVAEAPKSSKAFSKKSASPKANKNDGLGFGGTGEGGGGTANGPGIAMKSTSPSPSPSPPPPPVAAAPKPENTAPSSESAPAPEPANRGSGGESGAPADDKAYTAVPVFFGTDRKREADRSKWDRKLAAFSGAAAGAATLGRAVISVPKQGREKGEIGRPEWDLFFTTVALRKEDLSRDFVLLNVDVLDRNSFLAEVKKHAAGATAFKDQAFVFVHGYRVSFDDALFRAAQITHDLGFDGLPFVYSWPSSAGVAGYLYDERRALGAREPLRAFLDMVVKESGAKKVHLIAHSMGAQALLEVLRDIRNIGGPSVVEKPMFNEVILAAPDVTRDNFGQIAAQIRGLATGMTLYASSNDKALRLSQKLSGASAGQVATPGGPMVIAGIDSIDVSAASTDFFSLNHSTFADRAQLLEDMRLIFEKGLRPPDLRAKAYTPVPGTNGTYWRFDRVP